MLVYLILIMLISSVKTAWDWDLSSVQTNNIFYASSIAVFKNRAFLALPRNSCYNNITSPTLIEVPWPVENDFGKKKIFPNYSDQRWGKCHELQNAVSVDIDRKRGNIWVLDQGNSKCSANVKVYNFFYNTIMETIKLKHIEKSADLVFLIIDPNEHTRVYLGGIDNVLVVISVSHSNVWKVNLLINGKRYKPISTKYLAISKVGPVLYLTGSKRTELFSMDLSYIRKHTPKKSMDQNITFHGYKLGPSGGLAADIKGGLNYYLTRDYVVLRWNTKQPLQAEYHNVLAQSYEKLPYISHLFSDDPQNSIWALVNPTGPKICLEGNRDSYNLDEDMPILKTRVVKLLQYVLH